MSNSSRRSDQHYHHYNYPSFSSSLLEEIYRSFDEDSERDLSSHRSDTTNNTSSSSYKKLRSSNNESSSSSSFMEIEKSDDKFRVDRFVLDQWMKENNNHHHNSQKINNRRNSMPNTTVNSVAKFNSSSSTSSSDSSSGICGFSSSDTDSLYGSSKSKSKSKPTLKPIKTTVNQPEVHRKSEIPTNNNNRKNNNNNNNNNHNNERNKEGNLQKRALKLYGDLKKVKQPISPGGKLATFLNSLFNSNASKKAKISSSSTTTSSSSSSSNAVKYSMTMSTPSTASSYSRSCLSKTPSSAGRFERRSVRFCPVNTVMAYNDEREDEDEEDHLRTKASKNDELKVQIMEKQRRVEEVAKELLKNYQYHGRKFQSEVNHNKKNNNIISSFEDEDEDEDEDDDASCCSADLFELDNLLEIGGNHQRYCEELPVYETTHVHTNRAIAKGFIL